MSEWIQYRVYIHGYAHFRKEKKARSLIQELNDVMKKHGLNWSVAKLVPTQVSDDPDKIDYDW